LVIDWRNALLLALIPQAFGTHWLLGANYLQHAHCDGESEVNYARNFTGWINYIWLNIGFHTAHHDHPKAHWSTLRTLHVQRTAKIDARLEQPNLLLYVVKAWLLGPWLPAFRSESLRVAAGGDPPPSSSTMD
jgi:fatty acid desaturase